MNGESENDPFYIGYLPKAPVELARFTRKAVAGLGVAALGGAVFFAFVLPYFGDGVFEFGHPREFSGVIRGESVPRLSSSGTDYLLVGPGKNGVAPEVCGAPGSEVILKGTLIQREGRSLLEATNSRPVRTVAERETAPVSLGRFTLVGEIVDSKCYFGVMNPAEGQAHRACASLCLRGGVPAVFVVRDRAGAVAHLLIADTEGKSINAALLPWIGQPVEFSGEVARHGQWLTIAPELSSLRFALR